jgi:DNA gyrase/topoisomerase IV subunit A
MVARHYLGLQDRPRHRTDAARRLLKPEKDRAAVGLFEIPYQVNKANLVIKIAELVQEKKLEGLPISG